MRVERQRGNSLDASRLYAIWRIRDAVFAFEQRADDIEADGIDLDPEVTHWWIDDDGAIASYLRTVDQEDHVKIGRVCTRRADRGRGLAGRLMRAVLAAHPGTELRMSAQAHLADWYAGFGFVAHGRPYVEAGIEHIAMRRGSAEGR